MLTCCNADSKQVCNTLNVHIFDFTRMFAKKKPQARDLVAVLTESKQQIDPRLHEMARYGGGGGVGRYGGGGRGGRGGGRGGGFTSSNAAPMGGNRRW